MIRRAEFPDGMHHWPSWTAWLQWVERHGFDPKQTALPGWVEADDEALTVTVEYWNAPPEPPRRRPVTHQLEGRALPFPPMYGPGPRISVNAREYRP